MYLYTLEAGEVEFAQPVFVVKESIGSIDIVVERKNGADGNVSIKYKTADINARGGKDYESMLITFFFAIFPKIMI